MHKQKTNAKLPRVEAMATVKNTTKKTSRTSTKSALKVSSPRKSTRKSELQEESFDMDSSSAPKSKIITRKYIYAVLIVLGLIGVIFVSSKYWVVAWVDNKPVTKFELYSLLEKRYGKDASEELIVEKLLLSEAQKQRLDVPAAEVQAEIVKIETQQGGAEQLNQILTVQNLSRPDFEKLVKLQLLKAKLFGKEANITEGDVDKYIEENKASLPPAVLANKEGSEAAQLRAGVQEQLKQMKVNQNFNTWLDEALKSTRVIRN